MVELVAKWRGKVFPQNLMEVIGGHCLTSYLVNVVPRSIAEIGHRYFCPFDDAAIFVLIAAKSQK
jgi:hypothetical protein